MLLKNSILNLQHGDHIHLKDRNGVAATFDVNIGDALLNGEPEQVWLKDCYDDNVFLRKDPKGKNKVGYALFLSLKELAGAVEAGQFYIG